MNMLDNKVRAYKHWTAKEKQYLAQHYPTRTAKEIAATLGRSESAVGRKAREMGISKKPFSLRDNRTKRYITPEQHRIAQQFLGVLIWAYEKNPDMDVGDFMIAYQKYIAGREMLLYDVI